MKKNQKSSLILKKNITFAFADWQIAYIERTFSSALANFSNWKNAGIFVREICFNNLKKIRLIRVICGFK